MELAKKFRDMTTCRIIHISEMEVERKYPIDGAERVYTRYGETVLLSLRDPQTLLIKTFLPKRYAAYFTEADIKSINTEEVKLHLIYKGRRVKSNSHLLDIE
jgi:hypothetical protein